VSRGKIAEDVAALLGCLHECENPSGGPEFDPAVVKRARAQFRALLAVARKAKTISEMVEQRGNNYGQVCGSEWSLVKAVRRLDRVSGSTGRKAREP
jgi:hypothetical protein